MMGAHVRCGDGAREESRGTVARGGGEGREVNPGYDWGRMVEAVKPLPRSIEIYENKADLF